MENLECNPRTKVQWALTRVTPHTHAQYIISYSVKYLYNYNQSLFNSSTFSGLQVSYFKYEQYVNIFLVKVSKGTCT